jgi:peptide/nickel transport system substrate-binding protein
MLSWSNFVIASEDEVEAAGGIEAVATNPAFGCGKYIFKEWVSGQSITLERNDNYWNPDYKGYFKTIVFTFTNDAAAREMAVESGDAQVALDVPVIQATAYGNGDNVNAVIYDFGQVTHLWMNMTEGRPTADPLVREAIIKAINYDALASVGTGGAAPAALGYLSPSSPYYNETYTVEERALDVEGAKALLEEAGYGDGLDLEILGLQDSVPTYTVIQENLRAIGINLNINTPDTAQFVGDAFGGNYDLIVVGEYIPNRNPSAFVFVNKASIDSGFVIGGPKVTTDEMNDLVLAIIAEEDNAKAVEMMGELEQIMKRDFIQANLYPELKAGIVAKDIKGYNMIERGFCDITTFYK